MSDAVKLLSEPTNYAVVQLPGRNFPGIVFQGDSLHSLLAQVENIRAMAGQHKDVDLCVEISSLQELLSSVMKKFEAACEREGVDLPYPKPR